MSIEEFESAEKTPVENVGRVRRRRIQKLIQAMADLVPDDFGTHVVSLLKKVGPSLVALVLATAHTWSNQADTEATVSKKVAASYETLAPATNTQGAQIEDLKRTVTQLTDSVQVLQALALARQPGFTPQGTPDAHPSGPRARHPRVVVPVADPVLVKLVRDNELKNKALKRHLQAEVPTAPAVPLAVPTEPPKSPQPATPPPVQVSKPQPDSGAENSQKP